MNTIKVFFTNFLTFFNSQFVPGLASSDGRALTSSNFYFKGPWFETHSTLILFQARKIIWRNVWHRGFKKCRNVKNHETQGEEKLSKKQIPSEWKGYIAWTNQSYMTHGLIRWTHDHTTNLLRYSTINTLQTNIATTISSAITLYLWQSNCNGCTWPRKKDDPDIG